MGIRALVAVLFFAFIAGTGSVMSGKVVVEASERILVVRLEKPVGPIINFEPELRQVFTEAELTMLDEVPVVFRIFPDGNILFVELFFFVPSDEELALLAADGGEAAPAVCGDRPCYKITRLSEPSGVNLGKNAPIFWLTRFWNAPEGWIIGFISRKGNPTLKERPGNLVGLVGFYHPAGTGKQLLLASVEHMGVKFQELESHFLMVDDTVGDRFTINFPCEFELCPWELVSIFPVDYNWHRRGKGAPMPEYSQFWLGDPPPELPYLYDQYDQWPTSHWNY